MAIDGGTAAWLARCSPAFRAKLTKHGLMQFNADQIAWCGVGRPYEAQADRERIEKFLEDFVQDVGVSDHGCGWQRENKTEAKRPNRPKSFTFAAAGLRR